MLKIPSLIISIAIITLLTACEKKDTTLPSDVDYISYGTSFGMCRGYCNNSIQLSQSEIAYSRSGHDLEVLIPEETRREAIDPEFWNRIAEKVDFGSFSQLDTIIGCPDCADGGAEWIEISHKGNVHKVVFEFRNEPGQVRGYIDYLRTFMHTCATGSEEALDFHSRTLIDRIGIVRKFTTAPDSATWLVGLKDGIDTLYYYDPQLSYEHNSEFRHDYLRIKFSGVLLYDSTDIGEPGENLPFEPFTARNLAIVTADMIIE